MRNFILFIHFLFGTFVKQQITSYLQKNLENFFFNQFSFIYYFIFIYVI